MNDVNKCQPFDAAEDYKNEIQLWNDHLVSYISTSNGREINVLELSSVLLNLRLMAETKAKVVTTPTGQFEDPYDNTSPEGMETSDLVWMAILEPITPGVFEFLNSIAIDHLKAFFTEPNDGKPTVDQAGKGKGFTHHHLMGVLKRLVSAGLAFMKRIKNTECSGKFSAQINPLIGRLTSVLCLFLQSAVPCDKTDPLGLPRKMDVVEMGIDIRCNIGLFISYSLLLLSDSDKDVFYQAFMKFFTFGKTNTTVSYSDKFQLVEQDILSISSAEVNRIGLVFGFLGAVDIITLEKCAILEELVFKMTSDLVEINYGYTNNLKLQIVNN